MQKSIPDRQAQMRSTVAIIQIGEKTWHFPKWVCLFVFLLLSENPLEHWTYVEFFSQNFPFIKYLWVTNCDRFVQFRWKIHQSYSKINNDWQVLTEVLSSESKDQSLLPWKCRFFFILIAETVHYFVFLVQFPTPLRSSASMHSYFMMCKLCA